MKNQCVCFTGHRPEKFGLYEPEETEEKIKKLLRIAVKQSIEDGYKTFISGMARGFDMWAADIVLEEKKKNPEIKLVCALPMPNFENRWCEEEKKHYKEILKKADFVTVVSPYYSKSCFQVRNIFMVNHSSRVIAAYNGTVGGTRNTVIYALSHNVEILNILNLPVTA